MRASTTIPPAFAWFAKPLFAIAVFFALATGEPAAAQGLTFVARQPSSNPARTTSFASLSNIVSISSAAPTSHAVNFSGESVFRITGNFPSRNLATLFAYQETKTTFVTEVHVPVAQFHLPFAQTGASNLRFGFFMQTLHNSDVALGPMVATQALHSLSQPRSASFYGVGVSIPLGRQSHAEISQSLPWTALQRFIHHR